jgi:hypothetical protein
VAASATPPHGTRSGQSVQVQLSRPIFPYSAPHTTALMWDPRAPLSAARPSRSARQDRPAAGLIWWRSRADWALIAANSAPVLCEEGGTGVTGGTTWDRRSGSGTALFPRWYRCPEGSAHRVPPVPPVLPQRARRRTVYQPSAPLSPEPIAGSVRRNLCLTGERARQRLQCAFGLNPSGAELTSWGGRRALGLAGRYCGRLLRLG